jgi:ankyrin repeat protein
MVAGQISNINKNNSQFDKKELANFWKVISKGDFDAFLINLQELQQKRSLENDFDINMPLNNFGWSALHTACYYGKIEMVRYLIYSCGASTIVENENGWNAALFCVFGKKENILEFLLLEAPFAQRPNLEHKSKDQNDIFHHCRSSPQMLELLEKGKLSVQWED